MYGVIFCHISIQNLVTAIKLILYTKQFDHRINILKQIADERIKIMPY